MRDGNRRCGGAVRSDPSSAGPYVGARVESAPDPSDQQGHSLTWLTRRVLLVGWDALAWAVALLLALALRSEFDADVTPLGVLPPVLLVAIVAQLGIGGILQTYRGRHCVGSVEDAINVSGAIALTGAVVFLAVFFVQPQLVPRSIPLLAVPIAVLIAVGSRLVVRLRRERRYRPDHSHAQRVIIYGAGFEGQQLLRLMLSDPDGGYLPVALLDDNLFLQRRRISGVAMQGTRADLAAAAARSRAGMLVIADRSLPPHEVAEIAGAARSAGLAVSKLPSLSELLRPVDPGPHFPAPRPAPDDRASGDLVVGLDTRREQPTSPVTMLPARPVQSRSKRLLDLTLCLTSVLIILPVLLVIAVVLKVSNGEVIYRAQRIGRDGKPFTMFKFATMLPGDRGPRITREGDPRITPIGRWLRATKLNELPQIFNVIKGDMSLVGPRPEDPRYAAHYSARQRRVLAVRPGMTSLAFLEFGDEQAYIERAQPADIEAHYLSELLPEKLDIELDYVSNWTLREDLRILARTLKGLIS